MTHISGATKDPPPALSSDEVVTEARSSSRELRIQHQQRQKAPAQPESAPPTLLSENSTFQFCALPPSQLFSFTTDGQFLGPSSLPPPGSGPSSLSRKRRRPLTDVDGTRDYNKKRRCRLQLITSRLSAPFAVPPTNIPERPSNGPRATLFNKERPKSLITPSSHLLRKAAILNKIRRDAMKAKEEQEKAVEEARRQFRFVVHGVLGFKLFVKLQATDDDFEFSERLAAAARAAEAKENIIQYRNRRFQRPPAIVSQGLNRPPCSSAPLGIGYVAPSSPAPPQAVPLDMYGFLPTLQRPPTPPSESELDRNLTQRGMGLHIGDVVF